MMTNNSDDVDTAYTQYAKFMAAFMAHYLDAKIRYDPLKVFLSSKIDAVPYQLYDFAYLMREYRRTGSIRALIAYETGLGKTILASMIIKELLSLGESRILILTPPSVLAQFQEELRDKFALHFERFVPDTDGPRIADLMIASIDTVKKSRWRKLFEQESWDLLVVDEFHRVSPGNLRGRLLESLTQRVKSLLALTATPHDGNTDRFEYRRRIIAPEPLIIRRLKRTALDCNDHPLFDQEIDEAVVECPVTAYEEDFYRSAERYAESHWNSSGAGALIAILIGRAISSSIRAGVRLLERRRLRLLGAESVELESEALEDITEKLYSGEELTDQEVEALLGMVPEERGARETELSLLRPVLEMGRELIQRMPRDSKCRRLLETVAELREEGHKCLIYTGFLETVRYLAGVLEQEGYRVYQITGEVSLEERQRIVDSFAVDNTIDILLGTDAMSESLNLQAASAEINYEVPWSPVVYIQRVGRIWRLGQRHRVLKIRNFLPAFGVERRVMEIVLEKVQAINEEFGEVGLSIFGDEMESVDILVRHAHVGEGETEVVERIEEAFKRTRETGRQVIEILEQSMSLSQVVSVEDLQQSAQIDLDGTVSEGDIRLFLALLRDAGYASGSLPDSNDSSVISTYHVHTPSEFIAVRRLTLDDAGIRAAIETAKNLRVEPDAVQFAYDRDMRGEVRVLSVRVRNKTVYQEPILVTPGGALTLQGVLSLVPVFADVPLVTVRFTPLEEIRQRLSREWLERVQARWEEEKERLQNELAVPDLLPYKRDTLRLRLKDHTQTRPTEAEVTDDTVLFEVAFRAAGGLVVSTEEREKHLPHEVEAIAMDVATQYYVERGYVVEDVSKRNVGYDLFCRGRGEIVRVEVKGIEGATRPVMTHNEYRSAAMYGSGFVLFVVEIDSAGIRPYLIPDPFNNLRLVPQQKVVYSVDGFKAFPTEVVD